MIWYHSPNETKTYEESAFKVTDPVTFETAEQAESYLIVNALRGQSMLSDGSLVASVIRIPVPVEMTKWPNESPGPAALKVTVEIDKTNDPGNNP